MVESIIVFFSHGGTVGCRVVVGFEKRSGNEVPKCCHKRGGRLGYDFKRQRIVKKFVAEKVVRPWPDRRLRPWDVSVIWA